MEIVPPKIRTLQQNKALHLFFQLLAYELNEHGLDIKKTLSSELEHPWSARLVKELIWRPVQDSYLGKKSTTKLETKEIDAVYDIINKHIGETFGLHIQFPSLEKLINQQK